MNGEKHTNGQPGKVFKITRGGAPEEETKAQSVAIQEKAIEMSIDDTAELPRAQQEAQAAANEATARSKRASMRAQNSKNGGANSWKKGYNDCCWGISCADYSIFLVLFFFLYCVVALIVYLGLTLNIVRRSLYAPVQPRNCAQNAFHSLSVYAQYAASNPMK